MRHRLARRIVDLYPRVWRERYAAEFLALLDDRDDLGWRDVADIGRGAVREWVTDMPKAIGLAMAIASPWLLAVRSGGFATTRPVIIRLAATIPAVLVGAWFAFSAEQLTGLVAAMWVVSGRAIDSERQVLAS